MDIRPEKQGRILVEDGLRWNTWRASSPRVVPDLSGQELSGTDLSKRDLSNADLSDTNLYETNLEGANLSGANLSSAKLDQARLRGADLRDANLADAHLSWWDQNARGADLASADLRNADLSRADLKKADLTFANLSGARFNRAQLQEANLGAAIMLETNFEGANLSKCNVYGASAWNVKVSEGTRQTDLIISRHDEPRVVVDDLEVAQVVYLMLNNEKIRNVLETIGSKGVLILGRFTGDRKQTLDAVREELRLRGFLPMMFDFERPSQTDFTGTIRTLAGLSRFVIVDITNPRSSPLELQALIPDYMIPFVPIIEEGEEPFSMFKDLKTRHAEWVLDVLEYSSASTLVRALDNAVIRPALKKAEELDVRRFQELRTRRAEDYL